MLIASISVRCQLVKFGILNLMTNPNKVYDTTPNLKLKISFNLNYFKFFDLCQFSTDLGQILDSTSYDQS